MRFRCQTANELGNDELPASYLLTIDYYANFEVGQTEGNARQFFYFAKDKSGQYKLFAIYWAG
ncbi:hypothetical protein COT42_01085 [Candidatus Saganbacteria bacterium CG08_land_8_20_14_0_20_45_16]|uniref:Uncharacterized protein n=1 Tax=Candidatus Saganbacteria bacterium CG08_land_8_20_14_0_20_45_16 TaxID=2014293 RepID=A0A2H0Y1G4_UNCSA|nr:MAG: hypothetical protein COT42_01085 [Candidatus Saganbacteria bacterium CG08_land_8_20_14_0_20_45_16]